MLHLHLLKLHHIRAVRDIFV